MHRAHTARPFRTRLARLNRLGLNRLTRRLFPHLSGFGVVVHHGRRSGQLYRTPVNVFPQPGGYVVALTYGANSDWVKNVVAAGSCELQTAGRAVLVDAPQIFHDEKRQAIRPFERAILRLLHVSDFMELHLTDVHR